MQLLANLAPHFLRHSRFDCIDDPVELDHHLGDVDALVTPVEADVPSIPAMSMNQAAVIGDAIGVFSLSGIRRPQHLPPVGVNGAQQRWVAGRRHRVDCDRLCSPA
ncbi:hypothetical protein, partial [Mycobacterium sp.]|uniref:hypothetical protein n=1 Tax=Mycobacterium sp. TaxID=1785 RepID=UPI003F95B851